MSIKHKIHPFSQMLSYQASNNLVPNEILVAVMEQSAPKTNLLAAVANLKEISRDRVETCKTRNNMIIYLALFPFGFLFDNVCLKTCYTNN